MSGVLSQALVAMSGDGFVSPEPRDFNLPAVFSIGGFEVTKPMLQLVLAAVLVFGLFYVASAKRAMVPGRLQYVGEAGYSFVRNTLGRDVIGSEQFLKYVPLLFSLFFFILFNNLFATIPFIQFPTLSRIGYVVALAGVSWVVYNGAGIRKHGLGGYLKLQTVPSGVPAWMLVLLIPLEFLSNILVRPFTLALRLFANMFAGHLLVLLFALGGEYMLLHGEGLVKGVGGLTWLLLLAISFLEILVQFLQAFIFTILTALYISSAVADEH